MDLVAPLEVVVLAAVVFVDVAELLTIGTVVVAVVDLKELVLAVIAGNSFVPVFEASAS